MSTKDVLEERLKTLTGVSDGILLSTYLEMAKDAIIRWQYPFATEEELAEKTLPASLEMKQLEIAVYLVNRQGTEGEVENREGVITRRYESGSVPESMLKGISRYVRAFR